MPGEDVTQNITTEYLERRRALIAKDRSYRSDSRLYTTLSPSEKVADEKLRALRKWEIENVWNPAKLDGNEPEVDDLFPGMGFLTAKSRIEKSTLYRLLQKMPKGGLLHCHLDATVDIRTLMRLAQQTSSIHIRINKPFPTHITDLSKCRTSELPVPEFITLKRGTSISSTKSIVGPDYQLSEWISMHEASIHFPVELGGVEGFDHWLYKTMTIDPVEAYEEHATVTKIWRKFESVFETCDGLFRNEPVFRAYVHESLLTAIADGISYVEARILFYFKTMFTADGDDVLEHREWLKIFQESVEDVKRQLEAENRSDEFVGAKIIYTTMRMVTHEEMIWYMEDCIALKKEFPDLIAGFDLVGAENDGYPLLYYLEELLDFQQKTKEQGLDIPFIFHAGECLGDGDEVDSNLYDAILLGTKRIGHGFSLVKHPHLMDLCKERNIALEVCPISNEVLRLTSTMPMHPIAILLNHGVPVTINSDDPAIWTSTGVSFDYYQVLISSEVSGLMTLADIARRSVQVSSLEDVKKKYALALWERKWSEFVEEVAALDVTSLTS